MHSRTLSNLHDLTPPAPEPPRGSRRRPPTAMRRPAMYLAVAAAGALMVNVLWAGEPPARAAQMQSVSIAKQLGVSALPTTSVRPLEQWAAARSRRRGEQTAAARAQTAADRTERAKRAAAAAAKAAAARAAAAKAAAAEAAGPA